MDFERASDAAPLIVTQIQSDGDDREWAVARVRNVTSTGFDVLVQEEEANDGAHAPTAVGFMALEASLIGSDDVFEWSQLTTQAMTSGPRVTHKWTPFELAAGLGDDPLIAASIATYNGNNPANLRTVLPDDGIFRMKVQEEQSADAETVHDPEVINGLAFSGAGALSGVDLLVG